MADTIEVGNLVEVYADGTKAVDDINSGFLQKMLVTPANHSSIILGRLSSDASRGWSSLIILVLAYVFRFQCGQGFPGIVVMLFIIAFFGLVWSGISLAPGLRTRSPVTVFGIAGFLTFPALHEHGPGAGQSDTILNAVGFERQPDQLLRERGEGPGGSRLLLGLGYFQRYKNHGNHRISHAGCDAVPAQKGQNLRSERIHANISQNGLALVTRPALR